MMNLRSLMTSESTTQNHSGHENIRRGRAASSRRFFTPPSPSGLACRLVLTLAVLLAGVNAAWGDETEIWVGNTHNDRNTIEGSKFPTDIASTDLFCIYTTDKGISTITTGWGNSVLRSGDKNIAQGSYYNTTEGRYEIPISDFVDNLVSKIINESNLIIATGWEQYLTKVSIVSASSTVDPFINEAASGCISTNNDPGEEISRELSSKEINLSGASLTGVKYVRVYLANDKGKAVDPSGLLSVSYGSTPAVQAGTNVKNGVYVYDGVNGLTLSNVSVTLNAGAGNFTKYQIVCLLANNILTATPNDGTTPLTQEPKWQEQYTYTFTYPVEERIVYVPAELNSSSELTDDYVALNYFTEALDFFEVSANDSYYNRAGGMNGNWFARWYVRHKDGTPQTLGSGLEQHATEWRGTIYRDYNDSQFKPQTDNGVHFSGTSVYNGSFSGGNNQQWAIAGMLGFFKVYRPSSVTDFSNYEVVFETTNECDSEDPAIKLRYIFKFTPPIIFEYDGEIANKSAIKQTLDARNSTSVTIDWTDSEKTTGAMTTTGALYGRFFVVDENGDAVDPTSDDHKLTVTGGTLCEKKASGYYIYNNGEGITIPTVTLSSTDAITKYQVKCWFATATTGVAFDDVITTKMTEEPDITNEYTYSFKKPSPVTNPFLKELPWSKISMRADASTTNIKTHWDTTWEELSLEQYVKWYVVDGENNVQDLVLGSSRVADKWSVDLGSPYTLSENKAILTGENGLTSIAWNTWGRPRFYAPAGKTFSDVENCKIICEVSEEASATATPNVRYTFSLYKSFLGELKDGGAEDGETVKLQNNTTNATIPLGNALTKYAALTPSPGTAKYARVWLTTTDGTMIDPAGKLTVTGATAYTTEGSTDASFGYYVTADGGVSLSDATLKLDAGTFNNYQIHVALSTSAPTTYEADYDYVYTFDFSYPIKTKYKTLIYDPSTGQTSRTQLFANWYEPVADCNSNRQHMASNGYARWYLIDNTTGNRIQMKAFSSDQAYHNLGNDYGYWRYKFDAGNFRDGNGVTSSGGDYTGYDPVVTLPDAYKESYRNVRLICVVTTLTDETAGELEAGTITNEPEEMQVKYVYDLRTEAELQAQPFVHYHGVHYPQYHRSFEDSREFVGPEQIDGIQSLPETGTAASGLTQLVWDYGKNDLYNPADNTYEANRKPQASPDYATRNIRQKTHTKVFDYYVKPGAQEVLELPFQYYDGEGHYEIVLDNGVAKVAKSYSGDGPLESVGSDTEPMGYIRWYDWKTDKASSAIVKDNVKEMNQLTDLPGGRGLYKTMINGNPTKDLIGVLFNAPASFNEEYLIACDVSRYMDGMDESKTYMLHEPTLSMRYIFRIHPAKEKAKEIEDASANFITQVEQIEEGTLVNKTLPYSDLLEYSGRTVVALDADGDGHFSMRTQNTRLEHYFVDSSDPKACDYMQWYAFYEDGKDVYRFKVTMDKMWNDDKYAGTNSQLRYNTFPDTKNGTTRDVKIESDQRGKRRLAVFELDDFVGEYTSLDGSKTKNLTRGDIRSLYVVGYLGNTASGIEKPVSAAELLFRRTPPQLIGNESEDRKQNFLSEEYDEKAVLDFNDFFDDESTRFSNPTVAFDNYAKIPMVFANAQYGFCYPRLYGQEATNWKIHHGGYWEGYGVGPLHGDYTLLKSMNVEGISETRNGDDSSGALNNESLYTLWYLKDKLYDVTHANDPSKYGTFLYIDAADQARTIGVLEFDASLCKNSQVFFTAYLADMTNGITPPQVRFRVYTYNTTDGKKGSALKAGETKLKSIPVVSFMTGDIHAAGATEKGKWYQVYGMATLPESGTSVHGESIHYYVDIDNYAENTQGADYAVDEIRFYTSTASVKVKQVGSICDEGGGVEVKIITDAENLLTSIDHQDAKLYYKIFRKHSDMSQGLSLEEALGGYGVYTDDASSDVPYRTIQVPGSYNEADLPVEDPVTGKTLPDGQTSGYYKGKDGVVYFQFDDRLYPLKANTTYFVSFITFGQDATGAQTTSNWGCPYGDDVCSVYSNDITPALLMIELESGGETSDGTISIGCGAEYAEKTFNITVKYPVDDDTNPYDSHSDVYFDFYDGSKAEFKAIQNDGGTIYLETALDHFRVNYPDFKTGDGDLPPAKTTDGVEFSDDMRSLILAHWKTSTNENGKLRLLKTNVFQHRFLKSEAGNLKFAAIPVNRHIGTDEYICSPLEFEFDVDAAAGAPKLELGFDDVTYPAEYTRRVIRIGLEQLDNLKNHGYKLHIPVSNYENKGATRTEKKLFFVNPDLKICETTDPTVNVANKQTVAKIYDPANGQDKKDVYVNTQRMYLPLDFKDCEIEFHEGYSYVISTSFFDEDDDESNPCYADLFLELKVVPEFVTWEAQKISSGDIYSGNWYNDDNWKRSTRAELYKDDTTAKTQNTATAGHPNGYQDNSEISASLDTEDKRPGFVPMKFTYVTMKEKNHSPFLFREAFDGAEKVVGRFGRQSGGDMINNENGMGTDTSPSGGTSNATNLIRYDMLVRYGRDDDGEGCKGHPVYTGYTWQTGSASGEEKVYDLEKFYGNICKEIYFKPGAELRMQQRLTYEKAWVEEELEPNKWYLMSTPLKGTYAGDMYVPATAKTDYSQAGTPSVTGRQVTEAFQAITFDKSKGYSRTQYPFYQHSWGLKSSKVYTKTDDVRATDYSAYLKFSTVNSNLLEWSHTFNDVQVPYNNYSGFAIRAKRKAMTDEAKALIRLPKADTSYDYYQWDNTVPAPGAVGAKTVTKGELYGRFVFDNTSANQEQWTIPLVQLQSQGTDGDGYTYYLVGNPFMASIDMGKFFGYQDGSTYHSYNEKLSPVYYIYKNGAAKPVDATAEITDKSERIIRPLQAFIVKCKADEAPENIVFNRWAITDGNYTDPTRYVPQGSQSGGNNPSGGTRALTLKATNDGGSSTASVNLSEAASDGYAPEEDATTLFDSNLSDVPVVYTVAGNKAVSIDTRPAIDIVPFGVACVASNELVSVKLSWSENSSKFTVDGLQFTDDGLQLTADNRLYVFDAVTGEMTEVTDGQSVSVQPNDYGRYFLTTRGGLTAIQEAKGGNGIVVSVRNKTLTVRSDAGLKAVRIVTVGGETVASAADCGTEASFALANSGVYIVEAQTASGGKTMKVVVR